MKFISLFAGIGGFDLALERLGHKCVYANDIDKYAKITYDRHFTNKLDCRSITAVSADEIPDHDLLCGGFPCQSFSIAGKRRGFNDTRGTLFYEIARILQAKKTRYFILENVKGLLSHDNGATFKTIIAALDELGYDLQWQVLNSKNFGVPQNRERVFIVGHLRGQPGPKIFPFGENKQETGIGIKRLYHMPGYRRYNQTYDSLGITEALDTSGGGGHQPCVIAPTIRATEYKHGDNQTTVAEPNMKIRRLTPIECERLQGFPDNWTTGVSDTQRYKQLGNAVTVNVVYEIAKRLIINGED